MLSPQQKQSLLELFHTEAKHNLEPMYYSSVHGLDLYNLMAFWGLLEDKTLSKEMITFQAQKLLIRHNVVLQWLIEDLLQHHYTELRFMKALISPYTDYHYVNQGNAYSSLEKIVIEDTEKRGLLVTFAVHGDYNVIHTRTGMKLASDCTLQQAEQILSNLLAIRIDYTAPLEMLFNLGFRYTIIKAVTLEKGN